MTSAKSNTKSSAIFRHFVICLSPGKTPASLEVGKVYERVRDATAESTGMLCIIDESGEDYLHPAALFGRISLPIETRRALTRVQAATEEPLPPTVSVVGSDLNIAS